MTEAQAKALYKRLQYEKHRGYYQSYYRKNRAKMIARAKLRYQKLKEAE